MNKKLNNYGFSLMEVMLTITILSVMVSLTVPRYSTTIEKTRSSEGLDILNSLRQSQVAFFAENNAFATALDQLDITITAPTNFNMPTVSDPGGGNFNGIIAAIQRNSGTFPYTLSITGNGAVTCAGSTICSNLQVAN